VQEKEAQEEVQKIISATMQNKLSHMVRPVAFFLSKKISKGLIRQLAE
jgi:hypothetical protein